MTIIIGESINFFASKMGAKFSKKFTEEFNKNKKDLNSKQVQGRFLNPSIEISKFHFQLLTVVDSYHTKC
jgi:hypothetical protein